MTDDWKTILGDDERIVWQGRPDGAVVFRPANIKPTIFGIIFAAFALFWMTQAAKAGGYFWMFGLIHFSVGIGMAGGSVLWDAWKRRHTWYTLTNQRAFIATALPFQGRRLRSLPVTPDVTTEYTGDGLTTIILGREDVTTRGRRGSSTRQVDVGFERIRDGDTVLRHLRKIEKATA